VTKLLSSWAACPACKQTRRTAADGLLRNHNAYVPSLVGEWSVLGGSMRLCAGSGQPGITGRNVQTVKPGGAL
jgi:hypothetical protein